MEKIIMKHFGGPPSYSGKEPTLDIHIGGSGQGIKIK